MSHLLDKSYGIGLHRYNPAKFPGAVFLDVADAQYNPLNPEEIVAGIHPAGTPGTYGVAKFKGDAVLAQAATPYKWDSSLEPYIDAEEGLLYVAWQSTCPIQRNSGVPTCSLRSLPIIPSTTPRGTTGGAASGR